MELTAFDKSLLNLLQANLPVCSHPYAKLAEQLGTEEDVVISRLQDLKAAGYLRRIGTFFNSNQLGYKGTLVALRVEPDRMQTVAEAINQSSLAETTAQSLLAETATASPATTTEN